jgi:CRISPR-associated protein Csm5
MPEYAVYTLKVSVLTPLHIGSGEDLLHEYDYAIYNGRTWRLNDAALLEAQDVDDPALAETLAHTPPARLLQPADFRPNSPFFRYVIQGTPRSRAEGAQVREQIKDVFDRPYLPGSSLKGALRTALAWVAWGQKGLKPEMGKLGQQRKWAAQGYEHDIFGRDPNHDLLRALQVSDSPPVGAERLMLVNARVLNRSGALGSPIELEAIRPDTVFEVRLKLDLALFDEWARRRGLNLRGGEWLQNLPGVIRAHTRQRIAGEVAWFKSVTAGARLLAFYQQHLGAAQLGANQALLQLGWGTGWEGKTFGSHLRQDPHFLEQVIRNYRLARGPRQPGDPFPKSRRVVVAIVQDKQGQQRETPASPLGWVLVEMTRLQGG